MTATLKGAAAAFSLDHRWRSILRAVTTMSLATFVSVLCGVGTNKIISVLGGPEGIARLGVYRLFTSILVSSVAAGSGVVIVRQIAECTSVEEQRVVYRRSFAMLGWQLIVLTVCVLSAGDWLAQLLFHEHAIHEQGLFLRIVIVGAMGVLLFQFATTLLNSRVEVRRSASIGIVSSATTLAFAYPLMRVGETGLALIIGASCFLAAGLGLLWFLRSDTGFRLSSVRLDDFGRPKGFPLSFPLMLHPFVLTGSRLVVQAILVRAYPLEDVGLFNASYTLESTAVLILAATMQSYFLPALSRLPAGDDQRRFFNRMVLVLCALALIGSSIVIWSAPIAVPLLFSSQFAGAAPITAVLAVSIPIEAIIWAYAVVVFRDGNYRSMLLLDIIWNAALVGGTTWVAVGQAPIRTAAEVYVAATALAMCCYGLFVRRSLDHPRLRRRTAAFVVGTLAVVLAQGFWATR